MTKTYCSQLWENITVDNNYNIFSCCHIKPGSFGNIKDSKLKSMINSPEISEFRQKSLMGRLECYETCNLIDKNNIILSEKKLTTINYDDLKCLHINFGEKCNIACIMCIQPIRFRSNLNILNHKILIQNIDLKPFEDIVIQGGEPLFIEECRNYLSYLNEVNKRYTLLTNGLLIDHKWAEILSHGAKVVSISINAAQKSTHEYINRGSNFDNLLSNIYKLRSSIAKNKSNTLINGRMTLTVHNLKEIPEFIASYKKLGFDKINFGFVRKTVPKYLEMYPDFKEQLKTEINDKLHSATKTEIDLLRLSQLDLLQF